MKTVRLSAKAEVSPSKNGVPRFSGIAYTGASVVPCGANERVVIDLAGNTPSRDVIPLLYMHDDFRPLGVVKEVTIRAGKILIAGSMTHPGKDRAEIVEAAKNGHEWQLSVGVSAAIDEAGEILPGAAEYVPFGKTVRVNGHDFTGPFVILRRWQLHEISIVSLGADQRTTVSIAAKMRRDMKGVSMSVADLLKEKGVDVSNLDPGLLKVLEDLLGDSAAGGKDEGSEDGVAVAARMMDLSITASDGKYNNLPSSVRLSLLGEAKKSGWTTDHLAARLDNEVVKANRPAHPGAPNSGDHRSDQQRAVDAVHARLRRDKKQPAGPMPTFLELAKRQAAEMGLPQTNNVNELLRQCWNFSGASSVNLPYVLADVIGRELAISYDESPRTFTEFSKILQTPDFRHVSGIRLGALENLEPVARGGDLKTGWLGDEQVYKIAVSTWGRVISIPREVIVDDGRRVDRLMKMRTGGVRDTHKNRR